MCSLWEAGSFLDPRLCKDPGDPASVFASCTGVTGHKLKGPLGTIPDATSRALHALQEMVASG